MRWFNCLLKTAAWSPADCEASLGKGTQVKSRLVLGWWYWPQRLWLVLPLFKCVYCAQSLGQTQQIGSALFTSQIFLQHIIWISSGFFNIYSWLSTLLTISGLLVKFLLFTVVRQSTSHTQVDSCVCCFLYFYHFVLMPLTELFWMHFGLGNGCTWDSAACSNFLHCQHL